MVGAIGGADGHNCGSFAVRVYGAAGSGSGAAAATGGGSAGAAGVARGGDLARDDRDSRGWRAAQQAQFGHGKQIYTNICAACHQVSGAGQEGLAPPLLDSEWLLGTPQRTARIVLNGVTGSIKVAGVDYQLEMPGLAAMSDQD